MGIVLLMIKEKIKKNTTLEIYDFKRVYNNKNTPLDQCFSWMAKVKIDNDSAKEIEQGYLVVKSRTPANELLKMEINIVYSSGFIEIVGITKKTFKPTYDLKSTTNSKFDLNVEVMVKFTDKGFLHLANKYHVTEHPDRINQCILFFQRETDCFGFLKIPMMRFIQLFGMVDNTENLYYSTEILINNKYLNQ